MVLGYSQQTKVLKKIREAMKYSNLNTKASTYNEAHTLYLGTHLGTFKRINVNDEDSFNQTNLEDLKTLTKGNGITTLYSKDSLIYLGREDGQIKCFSIEDNSFNPSISFKVEKKVTGICCPSDFLTVVAEESGQLTFFNNSQQNNKKKKKDANKETLQIGDNISRMRQNPNELTKVAIGGKNAQNNLKILDLESKKVLWTSKNLPNDSLDLEVPIWDTDMSFMGSTQVATCSRYGYVRVYDTQKQRRPVLNYKNEKEQIAYTSLITHENMIYVGSNIGLLRAFDSRTMKIPVHVYKGFPGSISTLALDTKGKYLAAGGLDRYVRVYDASSTVMQYQCYAKTKVTQILLKNIKKEEIKDEEEEGEEGESTTKRKLEQEEDAEYEQLFKTMETVEEPMGIIKKKKKASKVTD